MRIHLLSTYLLWLVLIFLVFFWVPSDTEQGVAQRIFYFHVPTAWTAFIAFSISFIYSLLYLKKRDLHLDIKAFSFAKIGWYFTSGVLITGPLWAKPIWGVYWNWSDQRLMTFFVLWLFFTAYLILRSHITELHKRARISAVLCILGFLDIPLVYFSIRIWDTPSHPGPVMGGNESSGIFDPKMRISLWYSFFCFLVLMSLISRMYIQNMQINHSIRKRFFANNKS